MQGRTERVIYPVDPELSSEDLTSRSIVPRMPFPDRKWSGGRTVLHSLDIDPQLQEEMDKICRMMAGAEKRTGWGIKQHGRFFD